MSKYSFIIKIQEAKFRFINWEIRKLWMSVHMITYNQIQNEAY